MDKAERDEIRKRCEAAEPAFENWVSCEDALKLLGALDAAEAVTEAADQKDRAIARPFGTNYTHVVASAQEALDAALAAWRKTKGKAMPKLPEAIERLIGGLPERERAELLAAITAEIERLRRERDAYKGGSDGFQEECAELLQRAERAEARLGVAEVVLAQDGWEWAGNCYRIPSFATI